MPDSLAILTVSPLRRAIGLLAVTVLAVLVLYIAVARPPEELIWRVFLLGFGGLCVVLGEAMRRATARAVHLRRDGLFDSRGRELARIEDIVALERGLFAFKPSNGFSVRLARPLGRAWAPGVWWRLGRWLGVGGVTSASQAKIMADMLAVLLAERSSGDNG